MIVIFLLMFNMINMSIGVYRLCMREGSISWDFLFGAVSRASRLTLATFCAAVMGLWSVFFVCAVFFSNPAKQRRSWSPAKVWYSYTAVQVCGRET